MTTSPPAAALFCYSGYYFYCVETTAKCEYFTWFHRSKHTPSGALELHHLEVVLARATFRAAPAGRNVFPACARGDAILRPAFGLVVDITAREAPPGFVGNGSGRA